MYRIKIYCNDGNIQYWEDSIKKYETHDKALIDCFRNSLDETKTLMETTNEEWFEVEEDFEVTETYTNKILELGTIFDVATVYYDHAPNDRENDCDIKILTGYKIIEE